MWPHQHGEADPFLHHFDDALVIARCPHPAVLVELLVRHCHRRLFGIVKIRIQRPSRRSELTALNDCEPPDTCTSIWIRSTLPLCCICWREMESAGVNDRTAVRQPVMMMSPASLSAGSTASAPGSSGHAESAKRPYAFSAGARNFDFDARPAAIKNITSYIIRYLGYRCFEINAAGGQAAKLQRRALPPCNEQIAPVRLVGGKAGYYWRCPYEALSRQPPGGGC